MLDVYQKLQQLVASAQEDVQKAAGGNKAAATRVRKTMQEVKSTAQALRLAALENKEPPTNQA